MSNLPAHEVNEIQRRFAAACFSATASARVLVN